MISTLAVRKASLFLVLAAIGNRSTNPQVTQPRADAKPAQTLPSDVQTKSALDADKTLQVHFESDAVGEANQRPEQAQGLTYELGVVGGGVAVKEGAKLSYKSEGMLNPSPCTTLFETNLFSKNAAKRFRTNA